MNSVTSRQVLATPLYGYSHGVALKTAYRAVLVNYADGRECIAVEQYFATSDRWGAAIGWCLDSLLGRDGYSRGPIGDEIAIDYGQDWTVRGMLAVLDEATRVTGEGR